MEGLEFGILHLNQKFETAAFKFQSCWGQLFKSFENMKMEIMKFEKAAWLVEIFGMFELMK